MVDAGVDAAVDIACGSFDLLECGWMRSWM
jgi:hypothetical protein